jgi:transposase-like protein
MRREASMTKRKRRKFTDEFKREAVRYRLPYARH